MLQKTEQIRATLIKKITDLITKRLKPAQAKHIIEFARQFYQTIAIEDIQIHSTLDLYGALVSHWELIVKRKPGEVKIRILNPHHEQHGWQSTHTIIEIAHDDMPFLVDSLRMELDRQGLTTHLMVHIGGMKLKRNARHEAIKVLPRETPVGDGVLSEAPIYIEVDRQTDPDRLKELQTQLERILHDVRVAVEDWAAMRDKVRAALGEIEKANLPLDPDEVEETKDFLRWLESDHFTFLGYRDYEMTGKDENQALRLMTQSGLGVLRDSSQSKAYRSLADLTPEARKLALSPQILIISKTYTRQEINRP